MCLRRLFLVLAIFAKMPVANAAISAKQAEAVIQSILGMFRDEIEAAHHMPLDIRYHWDNLIFQALGGRMESDVRLEFYGGLLEGEMTEDALATVVCHEVGHILGGYPEIKPYAFPKNSVEGQADYFATAKCLRRLFARDDNQRWLHGKMVGEDIVSPCQQAYESDDERALCQRVLMVAKSAFQLMTRRSDLSFANFDRDVVTTTSMGYPSLQCRLDTMLAGAICRVPPEAGFSFSDPRAGACWDEEGRRGTGARPACWFAADSLDEEDLGQGS